MRTQAPLPLGADRNIPRPMEFYSDATVGRSPRRSRRRQGHAPFRADRDNRERLRPSSRGAPWLPDYLAEFMLFPNARYDDQLNSTAQALAFAKQSPAGQGMLELVHGIPDCRLATPTGLYEIVCAATSAQEKTRAPRPPRRRRRSRKRPDAGRRRAYRCNEWLESDLITCYVSQS